jgi:L-alanine-DL-glutamate epimerase-like enolase superfamily enzyme
MSEKNSHPENRRNFLKKVSLGGLGAGIAMGSSASSGIITAEPQKVQPPVLQPSTKLRITDLRCAIIGTSAVIRITTNKGISGYAQGDYTKNFLKPFVLFYKDYLIGEDPTDVERVMKKIRRMGSFKPWGAAVSAIEIALWDIAGKAAGVPVYKLLGGKVRDHVRVYDGQVRFQVIGEQPEHYAERVSQIMTKATENFSIIKIGIGFHSKMASEIPDFFYGKPQKGESLQKDKNDNSGSAAIQTKPAPHPNRGPITEKGFKHIIACVAAMKEVTGDKVGLALDIGPGYMLSDAIRIAKALEPFNLMWVEDLLTGDYNPYVMADNYLELRRATSTPIHTGEQIYLRQNFRELIEKNAVSVLGPDPGDVGGIAEMKWIAEYADLHGIQFAPHGIFNGLFGVAAQVQLGAVCPDNYIAFEYSIGSPKWWYDIVEGLPNPIVKDGLIAVWDKPGIGVDFIVDKARAYLSEEDKNFFD